MKTETFNAWVIDTRSDEGHGLIGRYWRFGSECPKIPIHMEGCIIALFTTRKIARENISSVKRSFPGAVVVKVKVTIAESGGKKQ